MVNGLTALIAGLLTMFGIAAVLFALDPLLLLFVLLAAVPGLAAALINSRASYAFEYAMTAESRERAYLVDLLTDRQAAKEVRLFELAPHLRSRYERLTATRLRHLRRFLRERLRVNLVATLAAAAGIGLALAALIAFLARGRIDVATAVTAGLAMQQLSSRLPAITGSIGNLVESGMFVDDYQRFLSLVPAHAFAHESSAKGGTRAGEPVQLAVEHVSFRYPGSPRLALDDVSLEVQPGEVVALVGENGSGKTTLVKLICQLYRPASGTIRWQGVDTASLPPEQVRSDITVLFQDFLQYQLPAKDNIVFGRVERSEEAEAIVAAAQQAGAHDFLARLPDAYDTRLGLEFLGGHELSIGQWQRLALARAFFRASGLLILDEPTASLDPRAESELFAQIRGLYAGRSVLLISHRFSSVRSADRIYVLESGRVTERGSHGDLIAAGGHYAELFNLQAAAYLDESAETTAGRPRSPA
jgi:ATP-binding cassette subfamily B protein